ncbi:hypothetical protein L3Q82_021003 [Scortum barcoo]|uniref:Uncharacterized protein n=1 Tax=Scortum barcoo TaxID=214431 RepID=A0ACB8X366_9TELE|nr:hypothetical protein L3Q82_021003 [Scortum barcoo]
MGNVRSLPNKMDELAALTRHQREYRECSLLLFTETWLTALTPDTAAELDGFKLSYGRTEARRAEQHCCKDIELLAVSMRPYYLPREFTHALAVVVQPAVTHTVKKWSEEAEEALKDRLRSRKEKRRAFVSGNKEELKSVQRELRRMIRKGKDCYRRKMEHQLQQNNICGVWKGLKTISGFKEPKSQPVGDQGSHYPPDTSISHSVLCTSPPINTSLLQPAPHNTPGEECPEEEQGQESSRSGWHQLQAPEVLRRPAVWDFWVHIQPEPEAGRVPQLWKTSCIVPVPKTPHPKELNSYRPVALTSHLMKTLERLVLAHLRPLVSSFMDLLQFAYQPDIGVDDAVIYLLHTSLTHLEKAGSTVRIMFFDFSSAFNTIQPRLLGDKLQLAGVDPSPHYMDFGLPHTQTTVCEGAGL